MSDVTPEIESYIAQLRDLRAEVVKGIDGLPAEALNWKPSAPDTNSLYVLAAHLAGGESWWIHQVVGGVDVHRNRASEFVAVGDDANTLKAKLDAVARNSEQILRGLSEADLVKERTADRTAGVQARSTRWCILHVIEHLARHVGHIELTRQLWAHEHKAA
ncbi:MAG: DUF664 domain-containing protein [Chloroflexi bacterium]|nr:DUF664 domain-containing protein [Chloroflexota bacterium]